MTANIITTATIIELSQYETFRNYENDGKCNNNFLTIYS